MDYQEANYTANAVAKVRAKHGYFWSIDPICYAQSECALLAGSFETVSIRNCLELKRVVLTLIGGGVFENPISLIWESIEWALDQVQHFASENLDVIVNGYSLGGQN